MNEHTLTKFAYAVFFVGIAVLALYSQEFEVESVATIESHPSSEIVRMKGIITRLSPHDNVLFAEIEGQRVEKTDVIVFTAEELFLKEGQFVEIEGKVEEYKGKKEIIASKVVVR
ncbi:hypothetical protein HYV86_00460 [Candidatus Woesearchaeota archaeon]|nr:hypothetical protein [Candidatus Woesearchaeota archaeon]